MKIAFEAKRAFTNGTGLGHYSRTLIRSLADYFPEHDYYLCTPKLTNRFGTEDLKNVHIVTPTGFPDRFFRSAWRSSRVTKDLEKLKIDLYHGLSHEIPLNIQKTGVRSVVTMHDLIFERYPKQFNPIDVQIYRRKFTYACRHSDHIIAISQQTKNDIIEFYGIQEQKISVCYQSCHPAYAQNVSDEEKRRVRKLYRLPEEFLLYVGSVIERKNLLTICKGLQLLKGKFDVPLIVIGDGGTYKKKVQRYIAENGLGRQVRFLSEEPGISSLSSFRSSNDFPAIYQQALCMIYPSFFEGFGIPVLEALWSRLPVITSNVSCLPETGGDAACYIDPGSKEQMAEAILQVSRNKTTRLEMIQKGWVHAQNFTQQKCATAVFDVYRSLLGDNGQ